LRKEGVSEETIAKLTTMTETALSETNKSSSLATVDTAVQTDSSTATLVASENDAVRLVEKAEKERASAVAAAEAKVAHAEILLDAERAAREAADGRSKALDLELVVLKRKIDAHDAERRRLLNELQVRKAFVHTHAARTPLTETVPRAMFRQCSSACSLALACRCSICISFNLLQVLTFHSHVSTLTANMCKEVGQSRVQPNHTHVQPIMCARNLIADMHELPSCTTVFMRTQELKGNVRVHCRVRPLLPSEASSDAVSDTTHIHLPIDLSTGKLTVVDRTKQDFKVK
jgi:hypothetical protein